MSTLDFHKRFSSVSKEVYAERARQIEIWSDDIRNPATMISIIGEEFGEVCKAFNDDNPLEYRTELIQLAACCFKAIESLDRTRVNTIMTGAPAVEDRTGFNE